MIKFSVFQHSDYKALLKAAISADGTRGYIRKLAEVAGCQRSYLSTVLHSHHHLTPDHACGIASFWKLTPQEEDYFLALVDHARSGCPRLKSRLEKKIKKLLRENENLSTRLERQSLSHTSQTLGYYSSWVWSALHIIVSIPEYGSASAISKRFNLPEKFVKEALFNLEKTGLVKETANRWEFASDSVHVPKDSAWVSLHHNNWRQRAVMHSQLDASSGVHFTTVTALSLEARKAIKMLILTFIDEFSAISEPSVSEEIVCLNLDFFDV
jgi:uncharacterized protein (TIGR02147 family)